MLISIISTIAMILSLLGNLLMAKKNILVFPVWILANTLWIVINFIDHLNIQMVLMYTVYTIIQIYSWIEWKKDANKTTDPKKASQKGELCNTNESAKTTTI